MLDGITELEAGGDCKPGSACLVDAPPFAGFVCVLLRHHAAAQLVACECVVLAETKDHANWELIGHVATHGKGDAKVLEALKAAHDECEEDEDHHVYHSKGWTRELWIQSLGLPAVLPPPEEVKKVDTAIGAARAEQSREQMPKRH